MRTTSGRVLRVTLAGVSTNDGDPTTPDANPEKAPLVGLHAFHNPSQLNAAVPARAEKVDPTESNNTTPPENRSIRSKVHEIPPGHLVLSLLRTSGLR